MDVKSIRSEEFKLYNIYVEGKYIATFNLPNDDFAYVVALGMYRQKYKYRWGEFSEEDPEYKEVIDAYEDFDYILTEKDNIYTLNLDIIY